MDQYRIDSHKLIYHPERVAAWVDAFPMWEKAKDIYPIYVEMSPFGACNHRCTFCALDYLGYTPRHLDIDAMRERLPEMAELGVKSIMFGGEGEPLLHKHIDELTELTYKSGIDIAITTNGVMLTEKYCTDSLQYLTWIKVSLNAGTADTYAQIHRTDPHDFHRVIRNLKKASQIKRDNNIPCTLGVQILLLPENACELETLARICRDEIGADYLVIKPYSQHLFSLTRKHENVNYDQFIHLAQKVREFRSSDFSVIFRENTMQRHSQKKSYSTCCATPFFWAYIMSNGDLYSCSAYLGDERFLLGNLMEKSFQAIWTSEKRRQNYELIQNHLDIEGCRINCRMDGINSYLWQLRHPHPHVNFI
jgi:GTP 3',8-cyclase